MNNNKLNIIERNRKIIKSKNTSYIYSISIDNIPIYIGSTNNIHERQKSHNSNIKNCRKYNWQQQKMYLYLLDNNITNIKLNIILTFNNITYENRYIEEERVIKYCFDKGIKLFNIKYPSGEYIEEKYTI